MHFEVTVRVLTDNDPSCNTYTYERIHHVRVSEFHETRSIPPLIKAALAEHEATMPHRHNLPAFRPTQVSIREVR